MTPFLELDGLTRRFDGVAAVEDVTVAVPRGAVLGLLGPSGSGKTTTLRMLAGFETPDRGRVRIDGEDVTGLTPERRRIGMVFQHYALFPHLDVAGNVGFGLESLGVSGGERDRRVADALGLVDLAGFERRRIGQLSGGQQQRVALARALAPEPRVLLLDEPLSNLDPALRERTRRELRAVIRRIGITTVLVTHEQEEAFDLADEVAVLRDGRVQQVDTPDGLYSSPANLFVARFVGRASTVPAEIVGRTARGLMLRVEEVEWEFTPGPADYTPESGPVLLLTRPEALWLTSPGPAALTAEVIDRRFLGGSALFTVRTTGGALLEAVAGSQATAVGAAVGVRPSRRTGGGLHLFPPADA